MVDALGVTDGKLNRAIITGSNPVLTTQNLTSEVFQRGSRGPNFFHSM